MSKKKENWKGPKIKFTDGSTHYDPRNIELAKEGSNNRYIPHTSFKLSLPISKRSRKEKPPRSATKPYPLENVNFWYNLPLAILGIGLMLITVLICLLKALGY